MEATKLSPGWKSLYDWGPVCQFQKIYQPGKPPGRISPGHLDRVWWCLSCLVVTEPSSSLKDNLVPSASFCYNRKANFLNKVLKIFENCTGGNVVIKVALTEKLIVSKHHTFSPTLYIWLLWQCKTNMFHLFKWKCHLNPHLYKFALDNFD